MIAETLATALGGRRSGGGWIARCPGHDDREPSLSIHDANDGKLLVRCHAGCTQEKLITALRVLGLWPHNSNGSPYRLQSTVGSGLGQRTEDKSLNRSRAITLWDEAIRIDGTIAAKYLASRGIIDLAASIDGRVLRFHTSCPFDGSRYPCMLALMRDIRTNEPRAIQRTALTLRGEKFGRRTLGPKMWAAMKLSDDEEVTMGLAIGEGVETVLSAMQMGFRPAWALSDAANMRGFPVLPGIECLTILVDHDENGVGQRAALDCSKLWTRAGHEVLRVIPDRCGDDLNDVTRRIFA
jgi:putative DNA primase/helicase